MRNWKTGSKSVGKKIGQIGKKKISSSEQGPDVELKSPFLCLVC